MKITLWIISIFIFILALISGCNSIRKEPIDYYYVKPTVENYDYGYSRIDWKKEFSQSPVQPTE